MISRSSSSGQSGTALAPVLLVEDEPLISAMLEANLTEAGFAVVSAGNGAEALAVLDQGETEFVGLITDVRMPEINGWDVARHAQQKTPELPVVYITGDSQGDWASQGVPNSELVEKPFTPMEVVKAIRRLIQSRAESLP